MLGLYNLQHCYENLMKIQKVTSYMAELDDQGQHPDADYDESSQMVKLNHSYRNLVMNFACFLLVAQMTVVTQCYKSYIPVSEKRKSFSADKIRDN